MAGDINSRCPWHRQSLYPLWSCLVCTFTRAGEFPAGTCQSETPTSWLPVMEIVLITGMKFLKHQTVIMRVCKDWNKQISAESGFRFCWQQLQATIACGTDSWQLGVCLSSSAWGQQSRCWCHQCHHGGCQRHSCHLSHGMDHLKPYSPECWTRNYLSALLMCYFATVSLKHSFSFVSNISASSRTEVSPTTAKKFCTWSC